MKKLLLLMIFLICNNTYSQLFFSEQDSNGYVYISNPDASCKFCGCKNCDGKGKYLKDFWVPCYNCKDWAESYRNARGCDVCKNRKGRYESRYTECIICAGKGKFHNRYGSNENIEKREEQNNNENYNNSQKSEDKRPFKNPELKKAKITGTICHPCN